MPTGYTAYIENGDITTGKDFLKLCTGVFGISIDMNQPLLITPAYFKPDPYYKECYDEAVKLRDQYKEPNFDEAKQEMIKKYQDRIADNKKSLENCKSKDKKYEKIRDEVVKWIPPTEEHERLKEFALDQLNMSMYTSFREYLEENLQEKLDISDEAVDTYIRNTKNIYDKNVENAYRRWQKDIQEINKKNLWVQQFLESLENI